MSGLSMNTREMSGSEYQWMPLLNHGYCTDFESGCNKFPYYLDATINKLDGFEEQEHHQYQGYTAVHEDLFMPTGY